MKRRESEKRAMTALLGLLLVPVIGMTPLAGCGHKAADPAAGAANKDAPAVQVVPVTRATLERVLPVTGTLMALPTQEATLSPPVAGVLDSLAVRSGQTVYKGQVIAHLSTRQLTGQIQQAQATLGQNRVQVQQAEANALQQQAQTRSSILQAQASVRNAQAALAGAEATLTGGEAALRNAEQSLTRAQTLFADGLVAQKDVEAAQLAVRTARAQCDAQRQAIGGQRQTVAGQRQALAAARAAGLQDVVKRKDIEVARQQVRNAQGALKTAQSQMALYTLRAPLSGQVTTVGANLGETVDTTTKVATIANLSQLQLQLAVPIASASQVHAGERVTFTTDALPGRTLQTTVQRVASQADPQTGTIPALAVIANPGSLKDDTTVRAQVIVERRAGILVVPKSALLTDPDNGDTSVVVVGTDEVAHTTPVTTGLVQGDQVEIIKGVAEGRRVAVSGQYGLPDGAKVSVKSAPGPEPAAGSGGEVVAAPGIPSVRPAVSNVPVGTASVPATKGSVNAPTGRAGPSAPSAGPSRSAPVVQAPAVSPPPNVPSGSAPGPASSPSVTSAHGSGQSSTPTGLGASGGTGSNGSGGASHGP